MNSLLKRAGNDALNANYPGNVIDFSGGTAQIAITVRGSDWYWTVCACMMAATLTFLGLAFTKPREARLFHYITAGVTMVASIAYFSMASNIGWAPIAVEFARSNPKVAGANREIFYVRYIDWFITTPLLLLDLMLTAGLPWPTLFWVILVDWVMIITGLVGALVRSSYKWGFWTFGMFALFYIGYVLLWEAPRNAKMLGSDVHRTFLICGTWTFALWVLYPVAWGLCEGGNVISPDSEAIFYGILDLLAKPVFGGLLIWGHRNIDLEELGLHIEPYGVPLGGRSGGSGLSREEKGFNNGTLRTVNAGAGAPVGVAASVNGGGSVAAGPKSVGGKLRKKGGSDAGSRAGTMTSTPAPNLTAATGNTPAIEE